MSDGTEALNDLLSDKGVVTNEINEAWEILTTGPDMSEEQWNAFIKGLGILRTRCPVELWHRATAVLREAMMRRDLLLRGKLLNPIVYGLGEY